MYATGLSMPQRHRKLACADALPNPVPTGVGAALAAELMAQTPILETSGATFTHW
jgi:hypothetical protein